MLDRIEPDSSEPVARRVFRDLRQAIVTMRFRPGQPLSEAEVAKSLGISRQPVREAFIKLSEAGLVSIRPQRGTFVVKISAKQVMDAQFVRQAVELAVVRKASQELSAAAIRDLHGIVKQQRVAAVENPDIFLDLDEAFHRSIALGVGCEYAWRVVEETKAQMDRVRYLSIPEQATPIERLITQHEMILEGIQARNPDLAESAMRLHMGEILTSLPDLEKRFPDLFDSDGPAPARGEDTTPRRVPVTTKA